MTEPVTAADVIADAVDTATNCFLSRKHLRDTTDDVVAALREACGGGDIVIRTDGTLAALRPWSSINVIVDADGRESCNHGDSVSCDMVGHRTEPLWRVVPVERGA